MKLLFFVFQPSIEEKIKNAPDEGYQIGIIIGSFIPFVLLIGIAYWMYYDAKKKGKNQ
jgi:hypothetical protein